MKWTGILYTAWALPKFAILVAESFISKKNYMLDSEAFFSIFYYAKDFNSIITITSFIVIATCCLSITTKLDYNLNYLKKEWNINTSLSDIALAFCLLAFGHHLAILFVLIPAINLEVLLCVFHVLGTTGSIIIAKEIITRNKFLAKETNSENLSVPSWSFVLWAGLALVGFMPYSPLIIARSIAGYDPGIGKLVFLFLWFMVGPALMLATWKFFQYIVRLQNSVHDKTPATQDAV